ncbi:MAG: hypothetical protein AB7F39_06670 [Variibacter sp.]
MARNRQESLEVTLARIDENVRQLVESDGDKEKRIRSLEKRQWVHSGVILLLVPFLAKVGIVIPLPK